MKKNRPKVILVILIFFCLSLMLTRPLILYFNQGIPYTRITAPGQEVVSLVQGDHLQLYYHFWLAKDALQGQYPFFVDPYEFSIEGLKIFTVRRIPISIIFVIFSVFGGAFAYNIMVIFSIAFSGTAMFLLAKIYLKNGLPAFTAGLIYASAPFALAQLLGGHTNGFLWGFVPLTVFSLEKLFKDRKLIFGFLYLFCLLSFALIEYHLLYYLVLFSLVFVPVRTITSFVRWKKNNLNAGKYLIKVWLAIALSLLLVFIFVMYLKQIEISASIAKEGRTLSEIRIYSPGISDLFKRINIETEKNIYLGGVSLVLAFLGFIFGVFFSGSGINKYEEKINLLFFSGGLLVSAMLALGTSLTDFFPIYKFFYKYLPYFNYPRVPGRLIVISFLFLAVLGGYGVKAVIAMLALIKNAFLKKTVKTAVYGFILSAIVFDYTAPGQIGITLFDEQNKIYKYIKENAGDKKVLEIPLWPGDTAWSSIYLYYLTLTRVKIINGYYPLVPQVYVDRVFYPLVSLNLGEITETEYKLLKKFEVKYIVLHENAFPLKVSHYRATYTRRRLMQSVYLKVVAQDKQIWLFELLDEPDLKRKSLKEEEQWITGVLKPARQFHHRIGKIVSDPEANNEEALFASSRSDRPGYLFFGRQQVFPRGDYKVIFHLKTDDNSSSQPIAVLEVCTDDGQTILAKKEIKGTDFKEEGKYQDFTVNFPQTRAVFPESRLYFLKKANLWADYIYILNSDQNDPLFHYEAEKLYYRGALFLDSEASGGAAVLFSPGFTLEKEVLFGPYRRFPKGDYQILFSLKTDKIGDFPLADLEVTADFGRLKLAELKIGGKDFKKAGTYQDFSLPVKLTKENILEFRIVFKNMERLWVDKVLIRTL